MMPKSKNAQEARVALRILILWATSCLICGCVNDSNTLSSSHKVLDGSEDSLVEGVETKSEIAESETVDYSRLLEDYFSLDSDALLGTWKSQSADEYLVFMGAEVIRIYNRLPDGKRDTLIYDLKISKGCKEVKCSYTGDNRDCILLDYEGVGLCLFVLYVGEGRMVLQDMSSMDFFLFDQVFHGEKNCL